MIACQDVGGGPVQSSLCRREGGVEGGRLVLPVGIRMGSTNLMEEEMRLVKGIVSRDILLRDFSWISFPPAPENPMRTVSNFFEKIRGDIRKSTGINETSGKFATVFNEPAANLPMISTTPEANFAISFASVIHIGGKFATSVNNDGNLPPVSTTLVANNGNNIRLLRPWSELEGKNVSISWLYFPKVSKLNN